MERKFKLVVNSYYAKSDEWIEFPAPDYDTTVEVLANQVKNDLTELDGLEVRSLEEGSIFSSLSISKVSGRYLITFKRSAREEPTYYVWNTDAPKDWPSELDIHAGCGEIVRLSPGYFSPFTKVESALKFFLINGEKSPDCFWLMFTGPYVDQEAEYNESQRDSHLATDDIPF